MRYGRFDARQVRGYVTAPLGETVAFDLSGLYYEDDGYIRDLVRNRTTGSRRSTALRGKLLFQPSDAAKIVLALNYNNVKDTGVLSGQPYRGNTRAAAPGNPPTIIASRPFDVAMEADTFVHPRQFGATLQTSFDLGGVSLETASAFQRNRTLQPFDADGSPLRLQRATTRTRSRYFSQEIRLLSDSAGDFTWLVGAFGLLGEVDVSIPIEGAAPIQLTAPTTRAKALAVFAEGNYEIVDGLKITLGSRYSVERREIDQDVTLYATNSRIQYEDRRNFERWTPRVALQYRFSPQFLAYASYSTGFKSGVYNISANTPNSALPETLDAFEIGIKSDPLPWLRINASAFYYDYKDIQVATRVGPVSTLLNASSARPRGGEIEVIASLSPDLSLRLGGTYVHAKYRDFPNALVTIPTGVGGNNTAVQDVSGNYMIRAPKYAFNFGANYSHDFGSGTLGANLGVYVSGKVYFDFLNRLVQPSYGVVNGDISWALPNGMRVGVWGRNLTNKTYAQLLYTTTLSDQIFYGRPREYGVVAGWKF